MAELVISGLAEGIISELGAVKAFLQEVKLLRSVEDEVRRLEGTVSTINAVLLDAEEKQTTNNQVKVWLKRLKDAMYDADDVADDFFTEVLRRKVLSGNKLKAEVRIFFSRNNQFVYNLKMGHKLKVVRKNLDDVAKDRQQFHFEEGTNPAEAKKRPPSHSAKPKNFIGREKEQRKVIDLLFQPNSKKNVSNIALVGHGGIGKTALTQQVFSDDRVARSFDLKIWVCVSENFEVERIVKMIIESITKKEIGKLEMNTLASNLQSEISGKKYLLVLDDVWEDSRQKWCDLEELLNCKVQGSKILVTTRSNSVVKAIGATLVHLEGLSKEQSWAFFRQVAFEAKKELRNQYLLNIGKRIAEKCLGVPLVIRTIGSLLYHENSESKWLEFDESEILKVNQEIENGVMSTLLLSYNHLPSHLKSCFAYCSLFPKDYWIDVETLVKLWMAQGFVKSSGTVRCLGKVGYEYFTHLLHKGFFQEEEMTDRGNVIKCKMHDLMHDLATKVAKQECKILATGKDDIKEGTRHVSVDLTLVSTREVPSRFARVVHLRTFLQHSARLWSSDEGLNEVMFKKLSCVFKYLRVLDLHGMILKSLPKFIGRLKHLRYLDLSGNEFKFMPDFLIRLVNLQTLKLNNCHFLERLPRDINRLVKLRHLEMKWCTRLAYMPSGLSQLSCLEALPWFMVCHVQKPKHCGRLSELRDLNNLTGELRIQELGHGQQDKLDFEAANLKEKKGLELLDLRWADVDRRKIEKNYDEEMLHSLQFFSNLKELKIRQYANVTFPGWMMTDMASGLPNLVNVELTECKCKQLPSLKLLPHLKYLFLWNLDEVEYIDDGSPTLSRNGTFFPSLENLQLWFLSDLKGWWREEAVDGNMPFFPCLSDLHIRSCTSLSFIPPPPNLKALDIEAANGEILKQDLTTERAWKTQTETSSSSSVSSGLYTFFSKLEALTIRDYNGDIEDLPEEWFRNLTSLSVLCIGLCTELRGIPDLSALTSLRSLEIRLCRSLKSLPNGLQHVTTLQLLSMYSLPNLEILPELPSSLQSLRIRECPQLTERCKEMTGEDWPKIRHIPHVDIE